MYTYKNISDNDLVIPNVGEVKKGETIKSETKLENVHLQEVEANKNEKAPDQPKS